MAEPEGARSVGARAMLDAGGVPLIALVTIVKDWYEAEHARRMAEAGLDDVRRAHNAVLANLPVEGARLTALADTAGITKQAMGEIVDDLEAKRYVMRVADPEDGRAKLIVWGERGEEAHRQTLRIFGELETELAGLVGHDALTATRATLAEAVAALLARDAS